MEANGLWVSDVCEKNGVPYNYGPNKMAFTSCILVSDKESAGLCGRFLTASSRLVESATLSGRDGRGIRCRTCRRR